MKIGFVTTNRHKVEQAKVIMDGIDIVHIDEHYDESSDDDNITIVKKASRMLADKHDMPIFVEDTSIFFDAYPGFPGSIAKFAFEKLGYEGIFRLLKGKKRSGYFSSAIGFCKPGCEPWIVEQKMSGELINEVRDKDKDVLPYTRIFIPNGFNQAMSELDLIELKDVMHRTKAMNELKKHLDGL